VDITLLPSTFFSDPTYNRILSGLSREFVRAGHRTSIVSQQISAGPQLRLNPGPAPLILTRDCLALAEKERRSALLRALAGQLPPGAVLNFHFSGWLRAWHAPVLLSKRLARARLVVTFHDYRHPDLPPLTSATRRALGKILDRAARITAVSGFLARMIREDFPVVSDKLNIVPDGTDAPSPSGAAPFTRRRAYILTVGRPAPYKGLDLLIFAFAAAIEKGCACDLVVCGTGRRGPLADLAKKLGIGGRVHFKGLLPPGEITALMKACLFYATTPRWESFGMSALEAMAAGKAVLAAKTGGLAEFARNGHNAVLVHPENSQMVSSAILRLCADKGFRKKLAGGGAATALEYPWKKIAGRYLSAYR